METGLTFVVPEPAIVPVHAEFATDAVAVQLGLGEHQVSVDEAPGVIIVGLAVNAGNAQLDVLQP